MTEVNVEGNVANLTLPAGLFINVKAKTNSKFAQKVTIASKDESANYTFTGAGERNTVIGQASFTAGSPLQITFEYAQSDNGSPRKSSVKSGGPYAIGSYNLVVFVAENGDDSDYNDSVVEFSWYQK